jgi:hypothetical protein
MPDWRKEQLFALVSMYYSLNGDDWPYSERRYYLNYIVSECEWGDVVGEINGEEEFGESEDYSNGCDEDGRLQQLQLEHFDSSTPLHGSFPNELSLLTSLKVFTMRKTGFRAPLADIVAETLVTLPNLNELILQDNSFSGSIPTTIALLTKLSSLTLGRECLDLEISQVSWDC